jgi:hypothetical protein
MIVILFMDGANKGFKLLMRDLESDYVPARTSILQRLQKHCKC